MHFLSFVLLLKAISTFVLLGLQELKYLKEMNNKKQQESIENVRQITQYAKMQVLKVQSQILQNMYTALDLMKKMLDPNPETRISISEAFQHPFLYREDENLDSSGDEGLDLGSLLPDIGQYEKQFLNSQKGSINDSYGSFHMNKKPLLNGEINTIEKVNENMQINSANQFKQKPAPMIKQSSYGRGKLFAKKDEEESEESKTDVQFHGNKQVNEMHKKAIMNNMLKGQGEIQTTPEKQPQKLGATGKSSSFKVKKSNE